MRKKNICIAFVGILFSLLFQMNASAKNYYVNTTGNDSNDGLSKETAWKTVAKACSSVAADEGNVINLGAGKFIETVQITIPSGVSLVGSGSASTIIKVNFYFNMGVDVNPHTVTASNKFVIQMNGSNQTVQGFELDGQNRQCHGGIFARLMTNCIFADLYIHDFNYCGLWVPEAYNVEIQTCHIKHCSYGSMTNGDSGNLMFQDGNGLNIHDNFIEESGALSPDMGGYGMKSQWMVYGQGCTTDPNKIYNLKIWNNTITVPQGGAWNNGQAPAITIEFLTGGPVEMEVYNNTFNNLISLPGFGDKIPIAGRIHNNIFNLGTGRYAYAIEAAASGLTIDHNVFDGGIYPIASFASSGPINQTIHHNIFLNQQSGREVLLLPSPVNFKLYNNTFLDNTGVAGFLMSWAAPMPLTNPDIRNNIFTSTNGTNRDIFKGNVTGGTVSNNCFYHVISKGSNTIITNPVLTLTGNKPDPYFQLKSMSNCINAGAEIAGITDGFTGTAPDLGAFENGQAAWTVGPAGNYSVTGVTVSPISATISINATTQLTANIVPANATNRNITWSSSNTAIATINSTGVVAGLAAGNITITATTADGAIIATSAITVSFTAGPTNIALNKYSRSSSYQTANPTINGNDGSTTTRWSANSGNSNEWWKVDLGNSATISRTEITWEKNGLYKYKIETSTDDISWVVKVNKTSNTSSAQIITDLFSDTARYVRISITGFPSGSWASLLEFKVYGSFVNPATGISSKDKQIISSLQVYPNPATKFITIDFGAYLSSQKATVTLTDLTGKVVYMSNVSDISTLHLSTSKFTKGVYLLNVTTESEHFNKKLIIQ
jgi:hypothetical protein